jgi:hypothetical protein
VTKPGSAATFKRRRLSDGPEHEIVKSCLGREELMDRLRPYAAELRIHAGRCFWWARYRYGSDGEHAEQLQRRDRPWQTFASG